MPAISDSASAWRIAAPYVMWLGALNLAWEAAQLPLYTIWQHSDCAYIAYAVLHCTAGDILIGVAGLLIAHILARGAHRRTWSYLPTAATVVVVGTAYTVYSEWLNTVVRRSWTYSDLMPVLQFGGLQIGLSPMLQWLILPPIALGLALRTSPRSRA